MPSGRSKLTTGFRRTTTHLLLLLLIIADNPSLGRIVDRQRGRSGLLGVLHGPVEDVVVLETLSDEQVSEQLPEVRVIGLVIESQGSSVVEVDCKLVGVSSAKNFGRGCHLLLHDTIVLLLLGGRLESLPRQRSPQKVHEDVTEGLEVISSGLLDTEMGVNGGVSRGTRQVLVLSVRDVQVGLWVPVLFGQTEIDHVDLVAALADSHQKVIGLDVSMDKVSRVNVFDTGDLIKVEIRKRADVRPMSDLQADRQEAARSSN